MASAAVRGGGGLRLGAVLGGASEGFERAESARSFQFPADHGAHPAFRSEWWYLTCPLSSATGAEFGVQFTLFRQALAPLDETAGNPWRFGQVYMAHVALTDVAGAAHYEDTRLARGHPQLAGVSAQPFSAYLENWQLSNTNLSVISNEFTVELALSAPEPIVLQGFEGLSHKGGSEASYYYSIPRMVAAGQITRTTKGSQINAAVEGACWFDREWGSSVLSSELVGWDWFALQFDDNSELMLFQLRSSELGKDSAQGKAIAADGEAKSIDPGALSLQPQDYWYDEESIRWPIAWRLQIGERVLHIRAALADQRMRTTLRYWEGLVWVYDDAHRRIGQGYLEMTGYASDG
jgi:predicted secreted hydrolase